MGLRTGLSAPARRLPDRLDDLHGPWQGTVEVLGSPAGVQAHRVAYVPQAEGVDWSFPVSVWIPTWSTPGARPRWEIARFTLGSSSIHLA